MATWHHRKRNVKISISLKRNNGVSMAINIGESVIYQPVAAIDYQHGES